MTHAVILYVDTVHLPRTRDRIAVTSQERTRSRRAGRSCAALKRDGDCGLVRTLGVCGCSCPRWPGGCQDRGGWRHSTRGSGVQLGSSLAPSTSETCEDLAFSEVCDPSNIGSVGPGLPASSQLSDFAAADGMRAADACCACGGGNFSAGPPHPDTVGAVEPPGNVSYQQPRGQGRPPTRPVYR